MPLATTRDLVESAQARFASCTAGCPVTYPERRRCLRDQNAPGAEGRGATRSVGKGWRLGFECLRVEDARCADGGGGSRGNWEAVRHSPARHTRLKALSGP
jgi:hypothetical protein